MNTTISNFTLRTSNTEKDVREALNAGLRILNHQAGEDDAKKAAMLPLVQRALKMEMTVQDLEVLDEAICRFSEARGWLDAGLGQTLHLYRQLKAMM